jgi:hypothetical protein
MRALELARTFYGNMKGVVVSRLASVEAEAEGDIDAATHKVDPKTKRVKAIAKRASSNTRARK